MNSRQLNQVRPSHHQHQYQVVRSMGELSTLASSGSSTDSSTSSNTAAPVSTGKTTPSGATTTGAVATTSCGPTNVALSTAPLAAALPVEAVQLSSSLSSSPPVSDSAEDQGEGQGRPQQNIHHRHHRYHNHIKKLHQQHDDQIHSEMDFSSKNSSSGRLSTSLSSSISSNRNEAVVKMETDQSHHLSNDLSSGASSSTLIIGKVTPKPREKIEQPVESPLPVVVVGSKGPVPAAPVAVGERNHILPNGYWNTDVTGEEDYQMLAVYTVSDLPTEDEEPNRAERSLPRNLYLKPSGVNNEFVGVFSTDYIPVGTRFGPVVGDRWHPEEVPPNTCRKYFWRVSFQSIL